MANIDKEDSSLPFDIECGYDGKANAIFKQSMGQPLTPPLSLEGVIMAHLLVELKKTNELLNQIKKYK